MILQECRHHFLQRQARRDGFRPVHPALAFVDHVIGGRWVWGWEVMGRYLPRWHMGVVMGHHI